MPMARRLKRVRPGRPVATLVLASMILSVGLSGTRGHAEFKGYFDISGIELAHLPTPTWQAQRAERGVRFLCLDAAVCPTPTAIEIKGVLRTEEFPAAFRQGPLSPDMLTQQGEINAKRLGSRFLGSIALSVGRVEGVQMTAASGPDDKAIYYLTTWLGRGDRMLDVKITSPDLTLARKLAEEALPALVTQTFK